MVNSITNYKLFPFYTNSYIGTQYLLFQLTFCIESREKLW